MANNYGENPPLSYNKYLRVQDLINLQDLLSTPAHHDELLFITVHQAYELWFKQILHELDAAIQFLEEDRVPAATRAIKREIEFSSGLKDKSILREFSSDEFASGRLEARMSGPTLADCFYRVLQRRGLTAPLAPADADTAQQKKAYEERTRAVLEVLTHFEERYEEYQLTEALLDHDEYFSLWRSHHIKMVERMVGAKRGTGGSEGIGYLKTTLDKKFFPELWEARTYLDVNHGKSGCPFAH
jgi:tryptophan 2,3-dioxygenase